MVAKRNSGELGGGSGVGSGREEKFWCVVRMSCEVRVNESKKEFLWESER